MNMDSASDTFQGITVYEIWNYLITMFFHYKNSPLQLEKFVFNVECILQGMMTQTGELTVIGKLYTCK